MTTSLTMHRARVSQSQRVRGTGHVFYDWQQSVSNTWQVILAVLLIARIDPNSEVQKGTLVRKLRSELRRITHLTSRGTDCTSAVTAAVKFFEAFAVPVVTCGFTRGLMSTGTSHRIFSRIEKARVSTPSLRKTAHCSLPHPSCKLFPGQDSWMGCQRKKLMTVTIGVLILIHQLKKMTCGQLTLTLQQRATTCLRLIRPRLSF